VYELDEGKRVRDLLTAAKDLTEDADASDINLAAKLIDGSTLTVPVRSKAVMDDGKLVVRNGQSAAALNPPEYTISGWRADAEARASEAGQPEPSPETSEKAGDKKRSKASAANAPAGPMDLNTATKEMLDTLPGIGPRLAEEIIQYRANSPFTSVDDLTNVNGIGPKKLEAIRPFITVHPSGQTPAGASTAPKIKPKPATRKGERSR
jgi:competence protein ComEA